MHLRTVCVAVILSASFGYASDNGCSVSERTTGAPVQGVKIQKVVMSGDWGRTEATVFFPDQEIAKAVIVFSHSAIRPSSSANVDLLPFAYTLARAGGAVILPERELVWPPEEPTMNREGAAVICAAEWLANRTKVPHKGVPITNDDNVVIREFYGYVGPRVCDPKSDSACRYTDPLSSSPRHGVWVPVGETEGGDSTHRIIRDHGLSSAQWLQRHLGLRPINAIERPAGT